MHLVFTTRSLLACIQHAPSDGWFESLRVPDDGTWGVICLRVDKSQFLIHRDDPEDERLIFLFGPEASDPLSTVEVQSRSDLLQRIHRVAVTEADWGQIRLADSWNGYHHDNRFAFFALPAHLNPHSLRWIAEIGPEGPFSLHKDLCFWRLTAAGGEQRLEDYVAPYQEYESVRRSWPEAWKLAQVTLADLPDPATTTSLQSAVDLGGVGFEAVTRHRTYSTWLLHLTPKQEEFVTQDTSHAVRLRGPAGSGKTLTLELKALREIYRAREREEKIRVLFATHSWAMAEQVDAGLRQLDETGGVEEIDPFPLLEISRNLLPSERLGHSFRILGEDSLSGKRYQLRRIDEIVDRISQGDWLTLRGGASADIRSRVEAPRGSAERNSLIWDLMIEFSSVLSAQGILPGITAERRYLELPRHSWMMPLETEADQVFSFTVYARYIESLKEERLLTSDQIVNDLLNYLETFTWNLERRDRGYDLIFVDELHLFNEQERMVLNYLARNPDVYPRMFMALDPRQAPYEVYGDFGVGQVSQGESGAAELMLGKSEEYELSTVHRFTPQILRLVQHIHRLYPALELGGEWELNLDSVESATEEGAKPRLRIHRTRNEELEALVRTAAKLSDDGDLGRTAVILLDPLLLPDLEEIASTRSGFRFKVVAGKDDVPTLSYARRSVALSSAEYVGGLQFGKVVVGGFPAEALARANLSHQKRRLLSLLYLAVSRAENWLEIHVNDQDGGLPEVLEQAVRQGSLLEDGD